MATNVPQVFLDANIVIAAGKPPGGPEITRVSDLVAAGMITLLTTDLTIAEIAKKHAENDFQVVKDFAKPHVQRVLESITRTTIPTLTKEEMRARLLENYNATTTAMFERLSAKRLSIDEVRPSLVFDSYTRGDGFFSSEGKKNQLPDAFIFERIKSEASDANPVIIVSNDGDYVGPVERTPNIELVASLPELFTRLGLEFEEPEVDAFLEEHKDTLIARVNEELESWGLIGDVEDSEIDEVNVNNLEINKLIAFKSVEPGDSLVIIAELEVQADISYSHPDWDGASYDSEDKVLIPWGTVEGETEVSLTLDVSMSIEVDEDSGNPLRFEDIGFRNDRFQYVVLHPFEDYK
ncbi:PIN domain-containing protein [Sinorhizobium meliloti]|uniref:PIN domain-containing protein n=1 Tax=Rhizobium meliloti TaxID=382 RepID=UPI001294E157|nr:PIN domain-containing protein [Sinorhizobium meliloti]MQX89019.1 hypothetical protein [Sinorhizobium meliloti]